jgi:hypothetical protein
VGPEVVSFQDLFHLQPPHRSCLAKPKSWTLSRPPRPPRAWRLVLPARSVPAEHSDRHAATPVGDDVPLWQPAPCTPLAGPQARQAPACQQDGQYAASRKPRRD